jgi:hypothetical protein
MICISVRAQRGQRPYRGRTSRRTIGPCRTGTRGARGSRPRRRRRHRRRAKGGCTGVERGDRPRRSSPSPYTGAAGEEDQTGSHGARRLPDNGVLATCLSLWVILFFETICHSRLGILSTAPDGCLPVTMSDARRLVALRALHRSTTKRMTSCRRNRQHTTAARSVRPGLRSMCRVGGSHANEPFLLD